MMAAILPLFLSETLKLSHTNIGIVEGVAIAMAFVAKVFSGVISDYFKKRKPLIMLGSLISFLVKPVFAVANSWSVVFFARFTDRLFKGIRSAPTDALIADLSNTKDMHNNYGFRQSMYALGAAFGSIIVMILLHCMGEQYRFIFWLSSIPAFLAIVILLFFVKEKNRSENLTIKYKWKFTDIKKLPDMYWKLLLMVAFLMLARFSEAFMTLKARDTGWAIALIPLMIITIEIFHSGFAYLNKYFVKTIGKDGMLFAGFILLILADIMFASANSYKLIIIGVILNGMHLGITQGCLRALIAKYSPESLYGTAFSIFYLVSGVSVFIGNYMAGNLSDAFGLSYAFIGGLIATVFALITWFLFIYKKQ